MLGAARADGIRAAEVKIRPSASAAQAWVVEEIRIAWPVAASAVAIDARDLSVVSRTDWDDFPLAAKAAEWGVDTHMGALWGLPNQIVLFLAALGIVVMTVTGYVMWWQRRPAGARFGRAPDAGALARAPWWGTGAVVVVAAASASCCRRSGSPCSASSSWTPCSRPSDGAPPATSLAG